MDGEHLTVPNNNYLKLSTDNIDTVGDEIVGCWRTNDYEWYIINNDVIILENKLDKTKFKFETQFPEVNGISTLKDFKKNGCFDLGFYYNELNIVRGEVNVD